MTVTKPCHVFRFVAYISISNQQNVDDVFIANLKKTMKAHKSSEKLTITRYHCLADDEVQTNSNNGDCTHGDQQEFSFRESRNVQA